MATAYGVNEQAAMQDIKSRNPASIIYAMCANVQSARIQSMGCVALCALSDQNPRNDTLIANTSGIPAVLSAMAMHTQELNVQKEACAVLRKITARNGNNREVIRKEKGINSIVTAMHQHQRSADVQEEACAALNNLSINNDENKNEILNAKGILAIITAMRENVGSVSMQEKACCALCNLSFGDDPRKRLTAIRNEGGAAIIIQTMKNHVNVVEVQRMACGTLRCLSKHSSKSRDDICSSDGISAIVAAMVSNPDEVAVQEDSCATLNEICKENKNKQLIGEIESSIHAIVSAMHKNHTLEGMQKEGISLLHSLTANERGLQLLKNEDPTRVRHVIEEAGNNFRKKCGKQAQSLIRRLERPDDSESVGSVKSQSPNNRAKGFRSMLNRHSKGNRRKSATGGDGITTVTEGTGPDGTRVQYIATTSFGKDGNMQTVSRVESVISEVETPLDGELKIGDLIGPSFASHVESVLSTGSSDREITENSSMRVTVVAPPGKLGIFLENRKDGRQGTIVIKVREESPLFEKLFPGDRIIAVDNENVTHLSVKDITTVMSRKSDLHRQLTVVTNGEKKVAASYSEEKYKPFKKPPHNDIVHQGLEKAIPPNNTTSEKSKTPEELLAKLLEDFSKSSEEMIQRMSELVDVEMEEQAIRQQIIFLENQQTMAADVEDFDRAVEIATAITEQKEKLQELKQKHEDIVQNATATEGNSAAVMAGCFKGVKEELMQIKTEQTHLQKQNEDVDKTKFDYTQSRIMAESKRLDSELKQLEQDEENVADEQSHLNELIMEQTGDLEMLCDDASSKLEIVNEEIEVLKQQLAEKMADANELSNTLTTNKKTIASRLLEFEPNQDYVNEKDALAKEKRSKWQADKSKHTAMVEDYESAKLGVDRIARQIEQEINCAEQLESFFSQSMNSSIEQIQNDSAELMSIKADIIQLQISMKESEALLLESKSEMEGLDEELKEIDRSLPLLKEEKDDAISRKDFGAAGAAKKKIDQFTARRVCCIELIGGAMAERISFAKEQNKRLRADLNAKQLIADNKEKEKGKERMTQIESIISKLQEIKHNACGSNRDLGHVAKVGFSALNARIRVFQKKGRDISAKFEFQWNDISDEDSVTDGEPVSNGNDKEVTSNDSNKNDIPSEGKDLWKCDLCKIAKFHTFEDASRHEATCVDVNIKVGNETLERLDEVTAALTIAVLDEDYEHAAELQDTAEILIKNLNETKTVLESALGNEEYKHVSEIEALVQKITVSVAKNME